jgi:uncharacterized protein YqeY
MNLEEKINLDIKNSILKQDNNELVGLRLIKSAIQVEKAKDGKDLVDEQVIKIIQKMISQSADSVLQYEKANRNDLVVYEKLLIDIYKRYLPAQLSVDVISEKIKEIIKDLNATTIRDMGKVMAECTKCFAGQADNKLVGSLVKTMLLF